MCTKSSWHRLATYVYSKSPRGLACRFESVSKVWNSYCLIICIGCYSRPTNSWSIFDTSCLICSSLQKSYRFSWGVKKAATWLIVQFLSIPIASFFSLSVNLGMLKQYKLTDFTNQTLKIINRVKQQQRYAYKTEIKRKEVRTLLMFLCCELTTS